MFNGMRNLRITTVNRDSQERGERRPTLVPWSHSQPVSVRHGEPGGVVAGARGQTGEVAGVDPVMARHVTAASVPQLQLSKIAVRSADLGLHPRAIILSITRKHISM